MHHLVPVYTEYLGNESFYLSTFNEIHHLYVSWFMPAFFLITGFCSSFSTAFLPFLKKNFLALIIPALFWGTVCYWGGLVIQRGRNLLHYIHIGVGSYWFLIVLFAEKLIYWGISRVIPSLYVQIVFAILLVFCGVELTHCSIPSFIKLLPHILIFYIFIPLGQLLKRQDIFKKKYLRKYFWGCFVTSMFFCLINGISLPRATFQIIISTWSVPLFIWLSFLGSISFLYLCEWIKESKFLEYFGEYTLLIYCLNFILLQISELMIGNLIPPVTLINSLFFIVGTIFLFVLFAALFISIFKRKNLSFFIGK